MFPMVLSTVVAAALGVTVWLFGEALGADLDLGLTVALSAGVTLVVNFGFWALRGRNNR